MEKEYRRSVAQLTGCAFIWGFGFIAARWTMQSFSPAAASFNRFVIAALVGLPFLIPLRKYFNRTHILLSAGPGLCLGLTLVLQNFGLELTTVGKSAFLTCLYVVFVPVFEFLFLRKAAPALHWAFVALALTGAALMSEVHFGSWNRGDLLTLACALAASAQILLIEVFHEKIESPFAFNYFQSLWAAILPWTVQLFMDGQWFVWPSDPTLLSVAGLVFMGTLSTHVAFFIQIKAQKVLPIELVSMLYLLESPAAAFFAFWLIGETPNQWQVLGAMLILTASALTIFERQLTTWLRRAA